MPKGPTWRWALLCMTPGLTACAAAPPIVTASAASCAALLPDSWKAGVPGAPLPRDGASVADWVGFADAQTGRLDQANGRTADAIAIVERCETRDAEAMKRARRGWLARLIG